MSHVVDYGIYDEKAMQSKKARWEIQRYWDEVAAAENRGEGATGLYGKIDWRDNCKPFACQEDAENYVGKLMGDYQQVAVKFYATGEKSKKQEELEGKLNAFRIQYRKMSEEIYYIAHPTKAKFLTCKHCGTKISLSHFLQDKYNRKNECPVCHTDLRPKAELEKLSKMKERIAKLEETQIELERKANIKNKHVCWLVKVEYHV